MFLLLLVYIALDTEIFPVYGVEQEYTVLIYDAASRRTILWYAYRTGIDVYDAVFGIQLFKMSMALYVNVALPEKRFFVMPVGEVKYMLPVESEHSVR